MFFQLHCMKSLQIECWTVYKKPFKQRNARRSVFLRFISVSSFSKLTNMSRKLVLSQCNWKQLPLKLKESSRKWNLSENYWKNSVGPLHVQSSCSTPFHVWHCKVASETSCLLALFTSYIQTCLFSKISRIDRCFKILKTSKSFKLYVIGLLWNGWIILLFSKKEYLAKGSLKLI